MEYIWAPWRMRFIECKKGSGCVFCKKKLDLVLCRGKFCYVLMNRYPYNNGHLMVVPYKHTSDISKLGSATLNEMMALVATSAGVLKRTLKCEGMNCGMNVGRAGGAGIANHLHMHVVPRWTGDSNFMPIIGKTKSMPEYLEATYRRLKPSFDRI